MATSTSGGNYVHSGGQVDSDVSIRGGGVRTLRHPTPPPRAINAAWRTISSPHTTAPTGPSYDSAMPEVTAGVRPNVRATFSPVSIKSPFGKSARGGSLHLSFSLSLASSTGETTRLPSPRNRLTRVSEGSRRTTPTPDETLVQDPRLECRAEQAGRRSN
ncbi:hypothetical protein GW17_00047372 [Ensete ventricosum]|nr:hypothetical protein GW17_00047372 [Ensete ventricosum]